MPPRSDISVADDAPTPRAAHTAVLTTAPATLRGRHAGSPLVAGRYRLHRVLGRGAMGTVWLAQDEVLRRSVALKQCRLPVTVQGGSLLCEARAAARIHHPGIVCVHDYIEAESDEWIVMEVLSGKPLSELIEERRRLPVADVRALAIEVLDALTAIHDAGLVHRDVKPSNIQMCDDGRVVLTDFGLTSASGTAGSAADGTVAGSLAYLAPEALSEGRFGPPSDLYAFGVTLYAAVEGRRPFAAASTMSRVHAVMNARPRLCRYAGPLAELIQGLLVKDPEQRTDATRARRLLDDDGWVSWWLG
jgi:serine/threonine protein kinase